jgi:NAD-dependent dihydropyrimidine dehydrogenase PreA subunit
VAKKIGQHNNEAVVNVATAMHSGNFEYTLKDSEVIGFVFPLYALSAPKMVFNFIEKLKFNNYKDNYLFLVSTYGQNITEFTRFFAKPLKEKGFRLGSGFSVNMPNNYFFIWDEDKQKECLANAEKTIRRISEVVEKRENNVFEIAPATMTEEAASNGNAMYNEGLSSTKNFYVTNDCNKCGLCEKVCNGQCIIIEGKPIWKDNCTKCFACIHLCPTKAIQYKEWQMTTETTGRYKNPNISIDEMKIL